MSDPSITSAYLQWRYSDLQTDEYINIRPITAGKATNYFYATPQDAAAAIAKLADGVNIYAGINQRHGESGKKAAVRRVDTLHGDVDDKVYPDGRTGALAAIDALPIPPTIIIDSGGGLYPLWRLAASVPTTTAAEVARVEALMQRIYARLGLPEATGKDGQVDHVQDLSRILRVPGTLNWKYDPPCPVTILRFTPEVLYTLEMIESAFPAPATAAQEPPAATPPVRPDRAPSHDDIRALLGAIPKRQAYDDWLRCLMAVHSVYPGPDGVALVEDWSPGTNGEVAGKFDSFKRGDGVGIGTLVDIARRHGWQPTGERKAPARLIVPIPGTVATTRPDEVATVPALPAFAALTPAMIAEAEGVRATWLDPWITAGKRLSPRTPASLLEAAGLFAMNLAIARRVTIRTGPKNQYPVLFLVFVGRSTLTGKSTALEVLRLLIKDTALLDLLLPATFTPQALLADLALAVPKAVRDGEDDQARWLERHRHGSQRGIVRDEVAGLLEDCSRDYNTGLLPLLLKLADAPDDLDTESTIGRGLIEVQNVGINLLGATTPAALRQHVAKAHHWANGLFGRLGLIAPDEAPGWAFWDDQAQSLPGAVVQMLRRLYESLPRPVAEYRYVTADDGQRTVGADQIGYAARQAIMTAEARQAYQRYDHALYQLTERPEASERLDPTYGRLPAMAVRVALALATMDWAQHQGGAVTIATGHFAAAQQITERWRAGAHRILAAALRSEAAEQAETAVRRLVDTLRKAGGSAGRGDVLRALNWRRDELDAAIRDAGDRVRASPVETGGRPGARLALIENPPPAGTTKGTKAATREDAGDYSSTVVATVGSPPGGNCFSAFSSNSGEVAGGGAASPNGIYHPQPGEWVNPLAEDESLVEPGQVRVDRVALGPAGNDYVIVAGSGSGRPADHCEPAGPPVAPAARVREVVP